MYTVDNLHLPVVAYQCSVYCNVKLTLTEFSAAGRKTALQRLVNYSNCIHLVQLDFTCNCTCTCNNSKTQLRQLLRNLYRNLYRNLTLNVE